MKVKRADVERAATILPAEVRLLLLHGPDVAGSAELADVIKQAAGADAEKISISTASLKADPARLADEAASFSLFGGKRIIVVDGGGDEMLPAVEGLLEAGAAGNLTIIVAGALKKGSKLLAVAEASPRAMAFASYSPEGRDAARMVADMGGRIGLTMVPAVARRVAEAGSGDRALVAHELTKFALFLDAAPDRPVSLEPEVVDMLSAGAEEGNVSRIVDAVLDGEAAALDRELGNLPNGNEVPLVRALGRRLMLLARYRAEVERGSSVSAVMASVGKYLFHKEKSSVERQLGQWDGQRLSSALGRLLVAERGLKLPNGIAVQAVTSALYALTHSVASRR